MFEQTAQFKRDQGLSVTEAGLAGLSEPPDVIVAANDDMALGAIEAVKAAGLDILVIGFDALPEALASIMGGELSASIEQFPRAESHGAAPADRLPAQRHAAREHARPAHPDSDHRGQS